MTKQRRICLTLEANGWEPSYITNHGSVSRGYQHRQGGSVVVGARGALTIYCGRSDCTGTGCRYCNQVQIRVIQSGATAISALR
jgi:predicted RNA binding protein YcfA (HicA-like mRNA interferase family)